MVLTIAVSVFAQSPATSSPGTAPATKSSTESKSPLAALLEANVKTEWEAFKNKDKAAYSNLLADDFAAVEDDNLGMRNRDAAAAEIDRSVVSQYFLFALGCARMMILAHCRKLACE
jgi:hypothetical protein